MEASGQLHAPVALPPGKEPPMPMGQEVRKVQRPGVIQRNVVSNKFHENPSRGSEVIKGGRYMNVHSDMKNILINLHFSAFSINHFPCWDFKHNHILVLYFHVNL
jgi:hypothetical protein